MVSFTRNFSLGLCAVCVLGLALSSGTDGRELLQCDVGTISLAKSGTADDIGEAVIRTLDITHGCSEQELVFNVMLAQREVEESIVEDISKARDAKRKKNSGCTSFEETLAISQALVPPLAKATSTAIAKANDEAPEGDEFEQHTERTEAALEKALDTAAKSDAIESQTEHEQAEILSLALATTIAREVSEAPCTTELPPAPEAASVQEKDPCDCSEDGVSNGVATGEPGCRSDNIGSFCYIMGNADMCEGAEASNKHLGAFWTDCN